MITYVIGDDSRVAHSKFNICSKCKNRSVLKYFEVEGRKESQGIDYDTYGGTITKLSLDSAFYSDSLGVMFNIIVCFREAKQLYNNSGDDSESIVLNPISILLHLILKMTL